MMPVVARFVIFLVSLAVCAALAMLALAAAGLGCLLYVAGKPLPFSKSSLSFWPGWLPALEIPPWAATLYIGLGVFILLVVLPFSLALLESLYVACRTKKSAEC